MPKKKQKPVFRSVKKGPATVVFTDGDLWSIRALVAELEDWADARENLGVGNDTLDQAIEKLRGIWSKALKAREQEGA